MYLGSIQISRHALQRFEQRWIERYGTKCKNFEKSLRKLLGNPREVKRSYFTTLKYELIYGSPVRFFFHQKWRWIFVVDVDLTKLITVYCLDNREDFIEWRYDEFYPSKKKLSPRRAIRKRSKKK